MTNAKYCRFLGRSAASCGKIHRTCLISNCVLYYMLMIRSLIGRDFMYFIFQPSHLDRISELNLCDFTGRRDFFYECFWGSEDSDMQTRLYHQTKCLEKHELLHTERQILLACLFHCSRKWVYIPSLYSRELCS